MSGTLYGIGVGPGDPELLTLKAHRILIGARVIAYPAPDDGESFARSIVADFIPQSAEEIAIIIPMRVERFPAKAIYDEAAETIAARLSAGQDVVVLCEGDPFFYGSFMYLFERLSGDHPCEIVPGISSLMASSAVLKRPLAARNDVLSIIPAPLSDDEIKVRLAHCDAAAFIKVGRHFERLRALLEQLNLTQASGYIERATLPNQKAKSLAKLDADRAPYFSMMLVYKGAEGWIIDEAST